MITSLTEEQEIALKQYQADVLALGRSTKPIDLVKATQAVIDVYALIDKPAPQVVLCDSPWQMAVMPTMFKDMDTFNPEECKAKLRIQLKEGTSLSSEIASQARTNLSNSWFGILSLYWLSFYDFPIKHIAGFTYTDDIKHQLQTWVALAHSVFAFCAFDDICFICERPTQLTVDTEGRLHNTDSAAMQFADGYSLYSVHGVRLVADLICNKECITTAQIQAETNAEVRRVMIDFYDTNDKGRFIRDADAKEIATDDFGTLYQMDLPGDEPLLMVKVVNSTAEPDGTFKDYFIRVQPELRPMLKDGLGEPQKLTAHNAVASTFGKYGHEYDLVLQT